MKNKRSYKLLNVKADFNLCQCFCSCPKEHYPNCPNFNKKYNDDVNVEMILKEEETGIIYKLHFKNPTWELL